MQLSTTAVSFLSLPASVGVQVCVVEPVSPVQRVGAGFADAPPARAAAPSAAAETAGAAELEPAFPVVAGAAPVQAFVPARDAAAEVTAVRGQAVRVAPEPAARERVRIGQPQRRAVFRTLRAVLHR